MKKGDIFQNVMTAVLVLCALLVTGLLVRRELATPTAEAASRAPGPLVAEWRTYTAGEHRAGPAEAPVTIVEFSDFQCPFCRAMAGRLDTLRAEYSGDVAVVYRHFPLRIHEHAVAAAQASECAGEQGRFWQMHDALYQKQDSIGRTPWTGYASTAGVADTASFADCMDRTAGDAGIRADTAAGLRLGVTATPTLLINEYRIIGSPPLDTLRAYVRRALKARGTSD